MSDGADSCYCTLALGAEHRRMARELALDVARLAPPETQLLIYTDRPGEFSRGAGTVAVRHRQRGIRTCYNDKRLVLSGALRSHASAIFLDADTRLIEAPPPPVALRPGLTAIAAYPILEHVGNVEHPERLRLFARMAGKLEVDLRRVCFVEESLFAIRRDGREREFLHWWGMVARYFELNGLDRAEGNAIGLAAAKVGWPVWRDGLEEVDRRRRHSYASLHSEALRAEREALALTPRWRKLSQPWMVRRRLGVEFRRGVALLETLRHFEFYYR